MFFGSLSYFLYSYVVTFGETPPAHGGAAAIGTNVLLFTAFAAHHSLFARARVRALVARVVPPALERSVYVWVASALFIAVCALWQPVSGVAWQARGPTRWLLVTAQAGCIWLTLRSAASLDILELAGIRQLSPEPLRTGFHTSGPYGWVRHPIYSGWIGFVFCAPEMTMTRLVFAAISSAYLLAAIPWEERSMQAGSGDAYAAYVRQVRWKLLPGVY